LAVIAVDFDGTLLDQNNIPAGGRMGPPTQGALAWINRWVAEGHQIVIFTARAVNKPEVYQAVEDWLRHFQVPYHGITNIKQPYFAAMIDNQAIEFQGDWGRTALHLTRLLQSETIKPQAQNK